MRDSRSFISAELEGADTIIFTRVYHPLDIRIRLLASAIVEGEFVLFSCAHFDSKTI